MAELLVEITTEELPALALIKELDNIELKWTKILSSYKLNSNFNFYYTPRRLVLHHENFALKQDDDYVEFVGPPKNIAYKEGKLSQAGLSFLKKAELKEDELSFKILNNKEVLYAKKFTQGKKSSELLQEMLEQFLKSLNFGKTMRFTENNFEFIRPIKSLVCILDDELVPCFLCGLNSAKKTFVHRSISYDLLNFNTIKEYFKLLEDNYIILNQAKRKEKIEKELQQLEQEHNIQIAKDDELLQEILAINEYPSALLGSFSEKFLSLPKEVIITSMRENQRYFAVFKANKLSNHFVVISNAITKHQNIINGNQRVLAARLNDAMFFYENDLKNGLNKENLKNILFFKDLGTFYDKSQREIEIAKILCQILENNNFDKIKLALEYAKADLSTQMVYEFTNLQGIIGSYYASNMFDEEITLAIKEQYLPNNNTLPSTEFSKIVALANKLDNLFAFFSIDKIPSGTKDPFGLRRAASGMLRIILTLNKNFDLDLVFSKVKSLYKNFDLQILKDFVFERLYTLYEANPSFIKAVLLHNSDIFKINQNINALQELSQKENFSSYLSTFKRLANIAVKTQNPIDTCLMNNFEKDLYEAFKNLKPSTNSKERLEELFALKPLIDAFFDNVMINAKEENLKANRQALIYSIYKEFLQFADFKELSV